MACVELCPGVWVGEGRPVFVIAELGQNHQGDVKIARDMISAAAEAGADCVKLQKSCLKDKFNGAALARPYTGPNSWGKTYGQHKEHLELGEQDYRELQQHAESLGVHLTASAMDATSAAFLHDLKVPFIKLGSGDVNNLALHSQVARTGRPMVVSTGMSSMSWVRTLHENIKQHTEKLVLMQCTSAYPTRPEDCHLRVLETYRTEFPTTVLGYSGHEEGLCVTLAAVALGAAVVERHFTLDRTQKGSDHSCSLEPSQLASLVQLCRQRPGLGRLQELCPGEEEGVLELALGKGEKTVLASELACRRKLGKTVVAGRRISRGEVVTARDVVVKVAEPPGIDPACLDSYIGKLAARDICEDESITPCHLTVVQLVLVQSSLEQESQSS